jgi:hypothetical protein
MQGIDIDLMEDLAWRDGDRSESEQMPHRPTIASLKTKEEPTMLEKIWQPLFKVNGEPTQRLGQFLRGLALHIIDDYEPKKSLVITPEKLKKFYNDIKLPDETYPWYNIFHLSNSTISKIYRDLKLEYFYVQERVSDPPVIPALTPVGFQRWMTLHIQAHPQAEFDRLAQAVRHMPISNADNPKERFPKQLSRRLLPKYDNLMIRQYCSSALSADGQITLPKHTNFPPPPSPPPPVQPAAKPAWNYGDRERTSYANQPDLHESTIHNDTNDASDDDSVHPSDNQDQNLTRSEFIGRAMTVFGNKLIDSLLATANSGTRQSDKDEGSTEASSANGGSPACALSRSSDISGRKSTTQKRSGDDESEDRSGDDSRTPKRTKFSLPSNPGPQRRLACPFHQRNPPLYQASSCTGPGFQNVAKLKWVFWRLRLLLC